MPFAGIVFSPKKWEGGTGINAKQSRGGGGGGRSDRQAGKRQPTDVLGPKGNPSNMMIVDCMSGRMRTKEIVLPVTHFVAAVIL